MPTPAVPLKVVIAGAGISGLSLAVGLLKKGYEVVVLERDLTAIRGEGKYRGPIQVRRWSTGPSAHVRFASFALTVFPPRRSWWLQISSVDSTGYMRFGRVEKISQFALSCCIP
jgi:glycine/D-amino acid oxidase-like deaminating enzyme